MYPTLSLVRLARLSIPSWQLTRSGFCGVLSRMSERRPDTESERPELVGAWVQGRYYMGEPDGDEGEYLSAESTVPIEHAR